MKIASSRLVELVERQRESAVDERANELKTNGYDFTLPENLREALQEVSDKELRYWIDLIQDINVGERKFEQLGRAMYCQAFQYWDEMATERAEREVPSLGELLSAAMAECDEGRMDRE